VRSVTGREEQTSSSVHARAGRLPVHHRPPTWPHNPSCCRSRP
jgi:hypothetical protein